MSQIDTEFLLLRIDPDMNVESDTSEQVALRRLAAKVVLQAWADVWAARFNRPTRERDRRRLALAAEDASAWLQGPEEDEDDGVSLGLCCKVLGLDAKRLAERIMSENAGLLYMRQRRAA